MPFAELGRKELFLLPAFIVAFKVLQVDCQSVRVECDGFADGEITQCNCSLDSSLIGTAPGCSPREINTAYVVLGEKPEAIYNPFNPSLSIWCLCCYDDVFDELMISPTPYQVPDSTCAVSVLQEEVVLQAGFEVNETVLEGQYVTCFSPCMPGNDSVRLIFPSIINTGQQGIPIIIIIIVASVGSFLSVVPLAIALTFLYVKYQRKQAWVIRDNRQSAPPPLPCLQNSGLRYIVDQQGLVVPATDVQQLSAITVSLTTTPETEVPADNIKNAKPADSPQVVERLENPASNNAKATDSPVQKDTEIDHRKLSVKTKDNIQDSNVDASEKVETTTEDGSSDS